MWLSSYGTYLFTIFKFIVLANFSREMDDIQKTTSTEAEVAAVGSRVDASAEHLRPPSPELHIDPVLERRVVVRVYKFYHYLFKFVLSCCFENLGSHELF